MEDPDPPPCALPQIHPNTQIRSKSGGRKVEAFFLKYASSEEPRTDELTGCRSGRDRGRDGSGGAPRAIRVKGLFCLLLSSWVWWETAMTRFVVFGGISGPWRCLLLDGSNIAACCHAGSGCSTWSEFMFGRVHVSRG